MQTHTEMNEKEENTSTSQSVDETVKESESTTEFNYNTIISLGNKVRITDKDEVNNLELYCYVHCTENDSENLHKCRGVVVHEKEIVLQAFPYTLEYNHTETSEITSNIDPKQCKIYTSYEGSLIRMFCYNDTWYTCTHRKLNAFRSKWASKESFGTGFKNSLENFYTTNTDFRNSLGDGTDSVYDKFVATLEPKNQYMFILTNNSENRIVCIPKEHSTIYHVGTFIDGVLNMDINCGIPMPEKHNFSSIEHMTKFVNNIDLREVQGVICYTPNNKQIKVVNKDYQDLFKARGNEPSIKFRYLQVRMNKKMSDMLYHLYPTKIKDFEEVENILYDICKNIYTAYVQRFIKKRFVSVPKEDYNVIKECHKWHETDRITNRITLEKVIKIVNEQTAINLNRMIRRFKSSKNEQETQQQNTQDQIQTATAENTPIASPMTFPTNNSQVVSPLQLSAAPPTQIPIKIKI